MKTTVALVLAALAARAAAQEALGMVVVRGTHDEDLYLAGGTVDSRARVRGDVAAAGGQVSVAGEVSGDVLAGGGQVDLVGTVGDDVRAAGGQVRLAGNVGGDAVAAAGTIGMDADATVGGRAPHKRALATYFVHGSTRQPTRRFSQRMSTPTSGSLAYSSSAASQ